MRAINVIVVAALAVVIAYLYVNFGGPEAEVIPFHEFNGLCFETS